MTETTTEQTVVQDGPLIVNALYNRFGVVMIAFDSHFLVQVAHPSDTKYAANLGSNDLIARPGSDEWIERMCSIRASLVKDVSNLRGSLQNMETWKKDLGDAILEKAIDKEWCEEYDEFAEEWDLPKREQAYEVTITLTVNARNGEDAEEMVAAEFGLNPYSDNVVSGPEYNAELS